MLQSFVGTFDSDGLRSLQPETEERVPSDCTSGGPVGFWAIIDTSELPAIEQAILSGSRAKALGILVQQARSVGRLHG